MRIDKSIRITSRADFCARRFGSTLILGDGRQVRVLTLPATCGSRRLLAAWDGGFPAREDDDLVVWWPPDPASRN